MKNGHPKIAIILSFFKYRNKKSYVKSCYFAFQIHFNICFIQSFPFFNLIIIANNNQVFVFRQRGGGCAIEVTTGNVAKMIKSCWKVDLISILQYFIDLNDEHPFRTQNLPSSFENMCQIIGLFKESKTFKNLTFKFSQTHK